MDQFYLAISLFRRKKFEECINVCNELLQKNPQQKGPWELKMRAMIQRVYVDDIEADDGVPGDNNIYFFFFMKFRRFTFKIFNIFLHFESILLEKENDDLDMNRLATAPRPGTTLRPEASAKNPQQLLVNSRPRTLSGRPLTGMVRSEFLKGIENSSRNSSEMK